MFAVGWYENRADLTRIRHAKDSSNEFFSITMRVFGGTFELGQSRAASIVLPNADAVFKTCAPFSSPHSFDQALLVQ